VEFLFTWVSGDEVSHETVDVVLCVLVHNRIYLFGGL
jgi:hypothetical protein